MNTKNMPDLMQGIMQTEILTAQKCSEHRVGVKVYYSVKVETSDRHWVGDRTLRLQTIFGCHDEEEDDDHMMRATKIILVFMITSLTFCSREKLRRRQVMFDQILRRRWNRIWLTWLTCGAFLWCLRLSIYRWIHPWLQSSFCPLISFFPAFFNLFWFLFVSSVIKRSWRLKIRQTFIITTIIHTVHI